MSQSIQLPITKEQVPAALILQKEIDDENKFQVMVKGYDNDFDNFTGIYADDYEDYDDCMGSISDYPEIQIWITTTIPLAVEDADTEIVMEAWSVNMVKSEIDSYGGYDEEDRQWKKLVTLTDDELLELLKHARRKNLKLTDWDGDLSLDTLEEIANDLYAPDDKLVEDSD